MILGNTLREMVYGWKNDLKITMLLSVNATKESEEMQRKIFDSLAEKAMKTIDPEIAIDDVALQLYEEIVAFSLALLVPENMTVDDLKHWAKTCATAMCLSEYGAYISARDLLDNFPWENITQF